MSDEQVLFVVICLIYLSDCCFWLKNQSVAFLSPWQRKWQAKTSNYLGGNAYGSLIFLNPFPPFGRIFQCHLSPISFSPTGICTYNLQTLPNTEIKKQNEKFILFDLIEEVLAKDLSLEINQNVFTKCASSIEATTIASFINTALKLNLKERENLIKEFIRKQFISKSVAEKLKQFENKTKEIFWLSCIFFVYIFFVIPILVNIFGLAIMFIPVVAIMLTFSIQISIAYYYAHKDLYPDIKQNRIGNIIKMFICPPVAIRARDQLTADLLSSYSPLVVATQLSFIDTSSFIRRFIHDLKYPLEHALNDPVSVEISQWYRKEMKEQCIAYIKKNELKIPEYEKLFTPPQPDSNCNSYCPRCESQFKKKSGTCPDCPGIELVPYTGGTTKREMLK